MAIIKEKYPLTFIYTNGSVTCNIPVDSLVWYFSWSIGRDREKIFTLQGAIYLLENLEKDSKLPDNQIFDMFKLITSIDPYEYPIMELYNKEKWTCNITNRPARDVLKTLLEDLIIGSHSYGNRGRAGLGPYRTPCK